MLIEHRGFSPLVDPSAYIAPTAVLVGRVQAGPRSRFMYGAVVDAEGSEVQIGEWAVICENAVLRATAAGERDFPVLVGDHALRRSPRHAFGLRGGILRLPSDRGRGAARGTRTQGGGRSRRGPGPRPDGGALVPPNTIALGDPLVLFSPDGKRLWSRPPNPWASPGRLSEWRRPTKAGPNDTVNHLKWDPGSLKATSMTK